MQIHQTPQYQDNGGWVQKHQQLKQLQKEGKATKMFIPSERPESPNFRLLRAFGSLPPPPGPMPVVRNFIGGIDNLPTDAMIARQAGVDLNNPYAMRELGQQQPVQQHQQTQTQVVRVLPGHPVFNQLRLNGFAEGGPVVLCRQSGQSQPDWLQREFVVRGVKNCYVVPLNESRIDLGRIQQNPHTWVRLVEVTMGTLNIQGNNTFLVPEQALRTGAPPGQQQHQQPMLYDSRRPIQNNANNRVLLG